MAYSAVSVANSIIKLANEKGVNDLTPMKLQKLMYFTQFFYLKNFHELLINDNFVRWKFGPVIPSIYYQLKVYGANRINSYIRQLSPNNEAIVYMMADDDYRGQAVLNKVFEKLGSLDAIQLSALTHRNTSSWSKNQTLDTVITVQEMQQSEI
ncbi:Panacea domain-containing protein [Snodgrassella communis]|uniref:Panacea domain-containing protein n=1 Tax=Snodgrassella communis TaxID=2946699 RepID=UPI001EF63C9B|nr:type II toxin-antitoxin system antitoxin SocA domain-containing protein [Snodgrassella communis]